MTPYNDSLWSQAPVEATHWSVGTLSGRGVFLKDVGGPWVGVWSGGHWNTGHQEFFYDLHERPQIYQSPAQLIEAYRKDHGAELKEWADIAMDGVSFTSEKVQSAVERVAKEMACIDYLLAAERARVEADAGGGS